MRLPFVQYGLVCLLVAVFIMKDFVPGFPFFSGVQSVFARIEMPVENTTDDSQDESIEKLTEKEPVEQPNTTCLTDLNYAQPILLLCYSGLPGLRNVCLPVLTPPPDLVV